MPAKPLTDEQKFDAARLKALFQAQKGLTQAVLADDLGFANQSAVSQYLNGRIPLNVEVAIKFADRFGCLVSDFSPSLQSEINKIAKYSLPLQVLPSATKEAEEQLIISSLNSAPEEKKILIKAILLDSNPDWIDADARAYIDSLELKILRWIQTGKSNSSTQRLKA
ncbi:helix-turn-helix domain-containing protein [Providencia heimbachae]|uniref:DNA-binding repressor n=1 Tax=Providencia heimbachae ATCC 35613 TaxID=1354272 RepID=A0A1B7JGB7_9GAMM|nr:helix-turn-helix transcriptional regulator [Providencia heimbachae]OAT46981.1 DNA-binding repressor [Providencia heimbachae ATCC 35613]SQH12997.1 Helix-turn-helix [Providencia heimbachae]